MVYKKSVVACVKANGKILREKGEAVYLPFGSEYSILLKNLDSVRVMAKVSIDGDAVTGDTWLVLQPNSDLELERYIRNGNLQSGNRFKFIERTGQIENHRGVKIDDGLIRIEYKKESVPKEVNVTYKYNHQYNLDPWYWPWFPHHPYPYRPWITYTTSTSNPSGLCNTSLSNAGSSLHAQNFQAKMSADFNAPMSITETSAEPGITVPGSQSNQQFHTTNSFPTENTSEVIILQLRGKVGEQAVQNAVTVDRKAECQTCGQKSHGTNSFCGKCGSALQII